MYVRGPSERERENFISNRWCLLYKPEQTKVCWYKNYKKDNNTFKKRITNNNCSAWPRLKLNTKIGFKHLPPPGTFSNGKPPIFGTKAFVRLRGKPFTAQALPPSKLNPITSERIDMKPWLKIWSLSKLKTLDSTLVRLLDFVDLFIFV